MAGGTTARKARRRSERTESEPEAGVPGLWRGTLSFGLVSVPIAVFPALRRRPVRMRMLAPDGMPLKREYVCPAERIPLERDDLIRGCKVGTGHRFVVVEDRELDAVAPDKGRDISLVQFADVNSIDPFFFERPCFLAPAGGSTKAYRLLAHVMERTGRAGIATFVMSGKEHLVAILAKRGLLMAEILRFAGEVRSPSDLGLKARPDGDPALVKAYGKTADELARAHLDERELEDRYARKFLQLVERRKRDRAAVVHAAVEEDAGEAGEAVDLVAVFKERMARAKAG